MATFSFNVQSDSSNSNAACGGTQGSCILPAGPKSPLKCVLYSTYFAAKHQLFNAPQHAESGRVRAVEGGGEF